MTRVGILGLGVGERHIGCFQSHPECEVALLCDTDPAKLQEVSERHPDIAVTNDPAEVLGNSEID